jgi:hypothetical protein
MRYLAGVRARHRSYGLAEWRARTSGGVLSNFRGLAGIAPFWLPQVQVLLQPLQLPSADGAQKGSDRSSGGLNIRYPRTPRHHHNQKSLVGLGLPNQACLKTAVERNARFTRQLGSYQKL